MTKLDLVLFCCYSEIPEAEYCVEYMLIWRLEVQVYGAGVTDGTFLLYPDVMEGFSW